MLFQRLLTLLLQLFLLMSLLLPHFGLFSDASTPLLYHDSGGVLEGEDTTFFCLINNLNQNDIIQFSHNNITISVNTQILGDNRLYEVLRVDSRTFVRFYLTIKDTSRIDSGSYGCHVLSDGLPSEISSSYASLSVYYLPSRSSPTCAIESSTVSMTFISGDDILLSCQSEIGQPPVSLKWTSLDQTSITSSRISLSNPNTITSRLSVQPQDGFIATCFLEFDTDVFPLEPPRKCSLGPFTILKRPSVTVQPDVITAIEGDTVHINCVIDHDSRYYRPTVEWYSKPHISEDRFFISMDSKSTLIYNISLSDNGTLVYCRATIPLASVEASSLILALTSKQPMITESITTPTTLVTNTTTMVPMTSSPGSWSTVSATNIQTTEQKKETTISETIKTNITSTTIPAKSPTTSSLPTSSKAITSETRLTQLNVTNVSSSSTFIPTSELTSSSLDLAASKSVEFGSTLTTARINNKTPCLYKDADGSRSKSVDTLSIGKEDYFVYIILLGIFVCILTVIINNLLIVKLFYRGQRKPMVMNCVGTNV